MIVQSAPRGQEHFVMTMAEHTAFAAELARVFGNAEFEPVRPRDPVLHLIGHHDAGWRELDALALADPNTGLPYHLTQTPFHRIVETSAASPARNAQYHPYAGLLSSMHSWGLYNGRYGMSDKLLLDALVAQDRELASRMLAAEERRQKTLRQELARDPETAPWIETGHLFQNYKQLQFFDTLALYFNCTCAAGRCASTFTHVPLSTTADCEVGVEPVGVGAYAITPFPFSEDGVELSFEGRYLSPREPGSAEPFAATLAAIEAASQTIRLVAA